MQLATLRGYVLADRLIAHIRQHLSHADQASVFAALRDMGPVAAGRSSPCGICLEPFATGDEVRSFDCRHPLHLTCIDARVAACIEQEVEASCPQCRAIGELRNLSADYG
jgi:hypothetical protein